MPSPLKSEGLALALLALACAHSPAIEGSDSILQPGRLVIFGEMHGTNEIPAFVGQAAVAAARNGRVHVGFELPVPDAPLLQALLAGDDEALGRSPSWRGPQQFGVTSAAMLALLRKLRDGRLHGLPIDIYFFDDRQTLGMEGRDEAMARVIAAERARAPDDIHLVVVGNFHARKAVGAPWDAKKRWMAGFLQSPGTVSLDVSYLPGTAWTCMQEPDGSQKCGANPVGGVRPPRGAGVVLEPQPETGFDGTYFVGKLTASAPAYP